MQAKPNLMSLEEASEAVRTFSGHYPVCLVTSPQGADIIRPILDRCSYLLNGTEVKLMTDSGCKGDSVFFLLQEQVELFIRERRGH